MNQEMQLNSTESPYLTLAQGTARLGRQARAKGAPRSRNYQQFHVQGSHGATCARWGADG